MELQLLFLTSNEASLDKRPALSFETNVHLPNIAKFCSSSLRSRGVHPQGCSQLLHLQQLL